MMTTGTEFSIYGVALTERGRLGLIRDSRIKTDGGSRTVSREWTGDEWPNTAKGARSAAAESLRRNSITAQEHKTFTHTMSCGCESCDDRRNAEAAPGHGRYF